mmetsp:Transcript_26539/g.31309  ORF Transcript_26539/g.31309 Transcript_26539/m.31309 type:complete len:366 (+) Transcript_26539:60-1157(+)
MIIHRSMLNPSRQWLKLSFLTFIILFIIYKFSYDNKLLNEQRSIATGTNLSTVPLSELTRNYIDDVECPEPLVPIYDRVVDPLDDDEQKIPRQIHLAWIRGFDSPQSRCISRDMMKIPLQWMKQFPTYSIYFHDDHAVDTLLNQHWSEFPHLSKMMKACVKFGSAMRIDIWRLLVLYKYGGFYSDFDVAPDENVDESLVETSDTGFFLSDGWSRPSQWLYGLEPNHPIAYFTILEIFKRLLALSDVSTVKLVFLTGPEALKRGYAEFMHGLEDYATIFDGGTHTGMFGKVVRKLKTQKHFDISTDIVPFPRNSTTPEQIHVKERIEREMNTVHWTKIPRIGIPKGRCIDHLYMNDNNLTVPSIIP